MEGVNTMESDGGGASQKIRCLNCGGRWYDIYRLEGAEPDCG